MKIIDHRLQGDTIKWQASPNQGSQLANGAPDSIVVHYTAGSSVESAVQTLSNPEVKASAHLVVGRQGEIYQLVPFNTVAWHAGRSRWQGRSGYNKYAVGIEIDNAGRLEPNGNGGFVSWFNKLYAAEDVIEATHRHESRPTFWHRYTEPQIEAVFELCRLLSHTYPIREILGHEEIAPQRKIDPGPAFPLDRLRDTLLAEGRDVDDSDDAMEAPLLSPRPVPALSSSAVMVTANKLNVRGGPSLSHGVVTSPLTAGTVVEVVGQTANWVEIKHSVTGWISANHISPI
jgi:N-acetyl-anhydromuramyl-L-alanine amidase AmpD